jgi:hypothetical protein
MDVFESGVVPVAPHASSQRAAHDTSGDCAFDLEPDSKAAGRQSVKPTRRRLGTVALRA